MPKNSCGQYVYLFINGYVKAKGIEHKAKKIVIGLKLIRTDNAKRQRIPE